MLLSIYPQGVVEEEEEDDNDDPFAFLRGLNPKPSTLNRKPETLNPKP